MDNNDKELAQDDPPGPHDSIRFFLCVSDEHYPFFYWTRRQQSAAKGPTHDDLKMV